MGATPEPPRDPGEPLGLSLREIASPDRWPELRAVRFEYSSRGDRVPGRLLLPPRTGAPAPVVLLQHGRGGSKDSDYIELTAGPWVRRGIAVASIDFPLHGERRSAKLTELFEDNLREPAGEAARILVGEFYRQAVADLGRAVDALERIPAVDARRLGFASFSLGTLVGAAFCGTDPRPRAAAFAIGGGGIGPPELDPARHVAGFAPRPALFVNATRDEVFSRESALALFAGCGEPKEHLWFEGTHQQVPGNALKAMVLFLERHLRAA